MSRQRLVSKTVAVRLGVVAGVSLASCSTYDALTIVGSRNPGDAARAIVRSREAAYESNPLRLVQDVQRGQRQFNQLVSFLKGRVGREWGSKEIVLPSRARYVKYTHNYKSRAVVDFDAGKVRVESLDTDDASLHSAIVTTLLTPDDPRAVDLYSDKTIKLSGEPYLYGLVLDQHNRPIDSPKQAEQYADYLMAGSRQERAVETETGRKVARYVEFDMVSDRENKQAERYATHVDRFARQYGVSKSLVYAVIKTESNFNPFAVSPAPAYGLMQLVPASGGREAYRYVHNEDKIPSQDYLFDATNNIELGTAYLGLINHRYLAAIQNPTSREYCTIASYNGGAGNVLRVFASDRDRAADVINAMTPSEVYRKLHDEYPRQETRRYLAKVLEARKDFANI